MGGLSKMNRAIYYYSFLAWQIAAVGRVLFPAASGTV